MRISDWSSDVCSSYLKSQPWRSSEFAEHATGMGLHRVDGYADAHRLKAHDGTHHRVIRGFNLGKTRSPVGAGVGPSRPEERRVGKQLLSTCRSWWSARH